MRSILEDVKAIHRDIGRDVVGYISHPINQFHLTRRLYNQWREVLQRILDSDTCVKGTGSGRFTSISSFLIKFFGTNGKQLHCKFNEIKDILKTSDSYRET